MHRKNLILAYLATIVQYYDYALFGISAAALTKAYMPESEHQMLWFYGIISFASVMKPIGSLIFGAIGDVKSRALALQLSVLSAAVATIIIGLMPSNHSILTAAILLIARLIFIASHVGEGDGVRVYVAEIVGRDKEFLGNGIVTFCGQIGVLIASLFWWLSSKYGTDLEIWRVNFIIGGIGGLLVFFSRRHIEPNNVQTKSEHDLIRPNITLFIRAIIIAGCIGGIYHFLIIFFSIFISKMTGLVSQETSAIYVMISVAGYAMMALVSGYAADDRRIMKQIHIGLAITIILGLFLCYAIYLGEMSYILILAALTAVCTPLYSTPLQIIIKRRMPQKALMSTFSLSHSLGSVIFSSSVPLISTMIWGMSHKAWLPALYVVVLSSTIMLCSLRIEKRN